MRQRLWFLGFALAIFSAAPASADTACVAGNLSNMIGTSCDIGPLRFTFTSVFSEYNVTNSTTGQVSTDMIFPASDFTIAPTSNGFTLTFLNGPQLMTESQGYHAGEDVFLSYNLTILDPGLVVAGETLSAGLSTTGSGSYSSASVSGWTTAQYFSQIYGGSVVNDARGSITTSPFVYYPNGGANNELWPGSSFPGVAAIVLGADNGNTAYWSGSMNVSFTTAPVPESSSLLLLGLGLCALAILLLRK